MKLKEERVREKADLDRNEIDYTILLTLTYRPHA